MASLGEHDIDGLRDLADRSRRAARTARESAADSEPSFNGLLTDLADHLESAAALAGQIADRLEGH